MNTVLKKTLLFVLIFALSLSMCACGKSEDNSSVKDQRENTQGNMGDAPLSGEVMWVSQTKEYYPFGPGYTVNSVARLGSSLLIAGAKDGDQLFGIAEYKVESDGETVISNTQLIDLDEPESVDETRINAITAGGDGYFYALTGELPAVYRKDGETITNTDYQGRYSILKYSDSGEFLDRMKITDWKEDEVGGIVVGNDGEVAIYAYSCVSLYRWGEGEVSTEYVDEDSIVLSAALCDKGIIVSTLPETAAEASCYYLVDSFTGALSELEASDTDEDIGIVDGNWSQSQGLDGEYIVSSAGSFLTLDLDTGDYEKLFQWNYDQYSADDCTYVCRVAENTYVCAVNSEYLLITGEVAKPYKERSVVKVALYDMDLSDAKNRLAELNANNSEYTYEYESYSADELDRLLVILSSENAPDLLLFNNNLDTSSDYFDDLYTYIDSDSELSRDSFIPNLLDALSINGQLYELWTGVEICTLAARTADVGDGKGLTPADYNKIVEENEQYLAVFQSFMSKENLLKWVADIGVSVYVDRDSGTCSFDNESFAEILAWCRDMGNDIIEGSNNSVSYDMSEVVLSVETISSPERLRYIRENLGEQYTFVGFPLGENNGSYYTCADSGCMAIPKQSSNKQGAWEYIRSQLETSTQLQLLYYLPVNYDAFQRSAASQLDDEELELLIDLVSNTTTTKTYSDEPLREIIMSGGDAYLAGDTSIKETVSVIQSRASIYMSEHYE